MKPKTQFYAAIILFIAVIAFLLWLIRPVQSSDFFIDGYKDKPFTMSDYEALQRSNFCGKDVEPTPPVKPENIVYGEASYYDYQFPRGSGYYPSKVSFTCATRIWPRGSLIEVTNLDNGKKVICKKTDHGPDAKIHPNRIVDLGSKAFKELAPLRQGLIKRVSIKLVK